METIKEKELLVRETLGKIADKWTLTVIDLLAEQGVLRFSRIAAGVGGISQKMLTKTLREMERDGLVRRHVYAEVPPRVEYELTPLGESLAEAACSIWLWVEKHFHDVQRARRTFEKKKHPTASA